MLLSDMEPHEQLAFAGLVRTLARQDGELSEEATATVAGLAREVGSSELWQLMVEAHEKLPGPSDVCAAAERVTRPEVRRFIYDRLVALAESDGVDVSETQLLGWLARAWDLD